MTAAVLLALLAACQFGIALVLTQFALRHAVVVRRRIDVDRSAGIGCDGRQADVFGMQNAVTIVEVVHSCRAFGARTEALGLGFSAKGHRG